MNDSTPETEDWFTEKCRDPEFVKAYLEEQRKMHVDDLRIVERERDALRLALDFALTHCGVFVDGTETCESSWHDEAHSSHSTCPSCDGPVDMTPHVSNRHQVTRYTFVSERVAEMLETKGDKG